MKEEGLKESERELAGGMKEPSGRIPMSTSQLQKASEIMNCGVKSTRQSREVS